MVKNSRLLAAGALSGAIVFSQCAFAEEAKDPTDVIPGNVSATVSATSNYLFRGISQTDNIPAVQGSFDYSVDLLEAVGFYAGVWGSNLNFKDGGDAQLEVDTYFGFQGSLNNLSWKLGAIYYAYPGTEGFRNYNYWEVNGSLGYDFGFASATVGLNYSPDYFAASGSAFYPYGDINIPIPIAALEGYGPYISGHIGHESIDKNAAFGTPDYTEWSIGVGAKIQGFDISVKYQDTDLSKSECFGGADWCGAVALVTVSRSFAGFDFDKSKDPSNLPYIPGEFSATLTAASNYLFRGITQTDNIPAVQGSFDYSVELFEDFSAYAGVWGSNLNFKDGGDAQLEVDTYFGVQGAILDKIDWKLGGIYYAYPGTEGFRNYNFWEIAGSLGYDFGFASVTAGLNYSPEYFAKSGASLYPYGDVTIPIPVLGDFAPYVSGHIGHESIDKNSAFGTPDYTEWAIGIGGTIQGLNLAIKYQDTNLSKSECFGGTDWCGATAVFTVSKTF
jgi:uncharacterized protein (TIGR02001 family)